ncbi:MAG: tRNA 2-thiouridine(34) synthase MnmA [Desulfobacteraceae bacterium]|jgi:tRNA-specific 2-thiouridylase
MKPIIAIALSGGVDSLVAARLLKDQGHEVFGVHFFTGYESGSAQPVPEAVRESAETLAADLAAQLALPVEVLDCSREFKRRVVDDFTCGYASGRTPNPCLICNPAIKFGVLLKFVCDRGASRLATGHYARVLADGSGGFKLLKGLDPLKEQSYFLARLTSRQLARACFPLGAMTKTEVLRLARTHGLVPIRGGESQDVCFVREGAYTGFLAAQRGFTPRPGAIVDTRGNVLGNHRGLHRFTLGQRRGINCPAPEPYYVVRIEHRQNRLVVGSRRDLLSDRCRVEAINWIGPPPQARLRAHARVRYRHHGAPATLTPLDAATADVAFDTLQSAVTPGQGAVFYSGEEVLGGGWISDPAPAV